MYYLHSTLRLCGLPLVLLLVATMGRGLNYAHGLWLKSHHPFPSLDPLQPGLGSVLHFW